MEFGGSGATLAGLGGGLSKFVRSPASVSTGLKAGEAGDIYSEPPSRDEGPITAVVPFPNEGEKYTPYMLSFPGLAARHEAEQRAGGDPFDGLVEAYRDATSKWFYIEPSWDKDAEQYVIPDGGALSDRSVIPPWEVSASSYEQLDYLFDMYNISGKNKKQKLTDAMSAAVKASGGDIYGLGGRITLDEPDYNDSPVWADDGLAEGGIVREGYAEGGIVFGGSGSSLAGLGGGAGLGGLGGGLSKFTRSSGLAAGGNGSAGDVYSVQPEVLANFSGETEASRQALKEEFQAGVIPEVSNYYVDEKYKADGGGIAGDSTNIPGEVGWNEAQLSGELVEYSKHMVPDWGFTQDQMDDFEAKMGYTNIPEGAWLVDDGANYIMAGGNRGTVEDHRLGDSFWAPANFNPNYAGDIAHPVYDYMVEEQGGPAPVPSWELAEGGIVGQGYAEGGEVIPDKGLTEFEEQLVQGAIQALSGAIQDPAAVQEILAELERTFGEGAVEELQAEIQQQTGPQEPDGMDDRVTANLTPGELVVSNPQLADYGNGDREAGAKKLQQHLADVSKAHRGTAATPSAVDPASLA